MADYHGLYNKMHEMVKKTVQDDHDYKIAVIRDETYRKLENFNHIYHKYIIKDVSEIYKKILGFVALGKLQCEITAAGIEYDYIDVYMELLKNHFPNSRVYHIRKFDGFDHSYYFQVGFRISEIDAAAIKLNGA